MISFELVVHSVKRVATTAFGLFVVAILYYTFVEPLLNWPQFFRWSGFEDKVLWDWLDKIIMPVVLVGGGIILEYRRKNSEQRKANEERQLEKLKSEEERRLENLKSELDLENQRALDKEQFSRVQFDQFLASYLEHSGKLASQWSKEEIQVLKYRSRVMFRTMTPLWLGEFFDFISKTGVVRIIPDIFDENHFDDIDIHGAIFNSISMIEVNFNRSNLKASNFVYGSLKKSSFRGCGFTGANFTAIDMRNVDFESCDMIGLQSETAVTASCRFIDCVFTRARLKESTVQAGIYESCRFTTTVFDKAHFRNGRFVKSSFIGATFIGSELISSHFQACTFESAIFDRAVLSEVTFEDCIFDSIDFCKLKYIYATFNNCSFTDTCILPGDADHHQTSFTLGNPEAKEKVKEFSLKAADAKKTPSKSTKARVDVTTPSGNAGTGVLKFEKIYEDHAQVMTPELKALAYLRKLGLQYKPDGRQNDIIRSIFRIIKQDNPGGYEKKFVVTQVVKEFNESLSNPMAEISNSRVSGVFKILLRSECLAMDQSTERPDDVDGMGDLTEGDAQEPGKVSAASADDTEVQWIDSHNQYISSIFQQFGATFEPA